MNTKIEFKSALFGLGNGILVTLAVAATARSGPVGRYQVAGTATHGLVIDTTTGQVWSKYLPQQSGSSDADFALPKDAANK